MQYFNIDGFSYMYETDEEEDNIKLWHYIVDSDGKVVADIDDSPYTYYDEARFAEAMRRWDRKDRCVVMPRFQKF